MTSRAARERNSRMKKRVVAVVAVLMLLSALALSSNGAGADVRTVPLEDVSMIVEVNSTDGDAGLQLFLDGEAWRSIQVRSPEGRKIFDVAGGGQLKKLGLTELFWESEEPSFDEMPLEEFLALFPEGEYTFSGKTVDGERLAGSALFSHDIPSGPVVVSPEEGSVVPADAAVVVWEPAAEPAGIDIVGFQVIVEREDEARTFQVDLPATATRVTIPPEFLEANTGYKVEVLAIEASGNQTITEVSFQTS
jgi:hypothetical protein